jgi:hypothetical protein
VQQLLKIQDKNDIEQAARIVCDTAPSSLEVVTRNLQHAASKMPKNKESTTKALRRLATYALRCQCLTSDLHQLANEDNLQKTPSQIVELLLNAVSSTDSNFTCIAALEGEREDIHALLKSLPYNFLRKADNPLKTKLYDFIRQQNNRYLIYGEFSEKSAFRAAQLAIRHLRPAIDIFNFYKNYSALSIFERIVVKQGAQVWELIPAQQGQRKLQPRRDARLLTQKVISSVTNARLEGRILNALEHHTLAHSSADAKIRLVNLWSALECLVGQFGQKESIVERIITAITPIIVWRQVDKIIRYLSICLHNNGFGVNQPSTNLFSNSGYHFVAAEEILRAVSRPENHPEILELLRAANNHPLLLNRVFNVWKTFSDPKSLKREMKLSEQQLRWHLYRIYRARNFIVHHGEEVPWVPQIFDHLQYYFSITLSRILHDLETHKNWNIDDSLYSCNRRLEYIFDALEKAPSQLRIRDFIPQPICLSEEPIWVQ